MATLKLKLLQSALPVGGENATLTAIAKGALSSGRKLLTSVSSKFSALDELAILAIPAMLKGRFIVLDDIERKHAKLSIDEVMGFIDEFSQTPLRSRFLLILNTDQLKDAETWGTLREKVIDAEVTLDTTPEEAFDIAIKLTPSKFSDAIKHASVACGLVNIRIAQRVIRSVNAVLSGISNPSKLVVQRVVPSTALLAAMHYKGLKDPPSVDFVRDFNTMSELMHRQQFKERGSKQEDVRDGDEDRARWTLLMDTLGIVASDELEALLIEYFESGAIDHEKLAEPIGRFTSHAQALEARNAAWAYMDRELWTPELSEAQLVTEANDLLPLVSHMDAPTVTSIHDRVAALDGGQPVAEQIVESWISEFEKRVVGQEVNLDWSMFRFQVHPRISEALKAAEMRSKSALSLLEASTKAAIQHGWGKQEEHAMKSSTPESYESEIRRLAGHDLKTFMLSNVDFYANRGTYEKHFGSAMENFVEACRRIRADPTSKRLARVITLVFEESKIPGALDEQPATTVSTNSNSAPD